MGKLRRDLTDKIFGKLRVLSRAENDRRNYVQWNCKCKCGKETVVRSNALIQKHTGSCGCYGREQRLLRNLKHGLSKHPLYLTRTNMLQRCYNEKNPVFPDYGGRGIKVCQSWKEDPVSFVEWGLENGWEKGLQLDRIDNDGGYSPVNCRFVTHRKNTSNTRAQHRRELPVGVRKVKNRFTSHIGLGSFLTVEAAENAYKDALIRLGLDA